MQGLVFLDKPAGKTSFQALSSLKRAYHTRKIGHTGTLDCFASGVMIVCVGSYTRLASLLTLKDKSYRATVCFGCETDTLDPEGTILAEGRIPDIREIEQVLPEFRGAILQRPPLYSAVHIDGKRAWQRARSGESPEMPERSVHIHKLEIVDWENGILTMDVGCSKGTYIRSLARDMALRLESRAYLSRLVRTSVGPIRLEDCASIEQINAEPDSFLIDGTSHLHKLLDLPLVHLAESSESDFAMGKVISSQWFEHGLPQEQAGQDILVLRSSDSLAGIIYSKGTGFGYRSVFL